MKQCFHIKTRHLILAIVSVAGGAGFYNGYSANVINIGIETSYNSSENQTEINLEAIVGLQSLVILSGAYGAGCFIGTILIPAIANNIGRKRGLFVTNSIGIAIPILDSIVAHQNIYSILFPVLSCSRFLLGIVNSISLGVGIIYLVEISPSKYRGTIGCLYPLFKLLGSSTIFVLTTYDYHRRFWPGLIAISGIPLTVLLTLLYFCPESPVFLHSKNKPRHLQQELFCVRNNVGLNSVALEDPHEMCTMSGSLPTFMDLITNIELRKPLIMSILVLLSTWLVGPYYVMPKDFLPGESQYIITQSLSITGIVICACAVDKIGRKPLFLVGLCSICINIILNFIATLLWAKGVQFGAVVYSIMTIIYALQAVAVFTLPFILICELSPKARPMNFSVSMVAFYIVNSPYELISKFFAGGEDNNYLPPFEALLSIVFIIVIKLKLPETKGKNFGDIHSRVLKW